MKYEEKNQESEQISSKLNEVNK